MAQISPSPTSEVSSKLQTTSAPGHWRFLTPSLGAGPLGALPVPHRWGPGVRAAVGAAPFWLFAMTEETGWPANPRPDADPRHEGVDNLGVYGRSRELDRGAYMTWKLAILDLRKRRTSSLEHNLTCHVSAGSRLVLLRNKQIATQVFIPGFSRALKTMDFVFCWRLERLISLINSSRLSPPHTLVGRLSCVQLQTGWAGWAWADLRHSPQSATKMVGWVGAHQRSNATARLWPLLLHWGILIASCDEGSQDALFVFLILCSFGPTGLVRLARNLCWTGWRISSILCSFDRTVLVRQTKQTFAYSGLEDLGNAGGLSSAHVSDTADPLSSNNEMNAMLVDDLRYQLLVHV
ncbi:hypothetical protein PAPYR_12499 [Paratrimastix pyriformis]|uniref:Uncharacterized protein n=1 Tax=Paratrimastix pyriformis TaxID=342808 RepID=A0ABQ8U1T7_9EUKA|nr:hypothetical protein PAPYR_12499 [Paratrimastix pyriformis]